MGEILDWAGFRIRMGAVFRHLVKRGTSGHLAGMIERVAEQDGQVSRAYFSPCGAYRYGLTRIWDNAAPLLLFVMLNPSTADEMRNDPTIERCQRRARALGYGQLMIANLFAYRATKPQDLRRAADPVGPENEGLLTRWSGEADLTIAAWGTHGALLDQATRVAPGLRGDVRHLGLTKAGHPRHPLYVPYAQSPEPWPAEARYA